MKTDNLQQISKRRLILIVLIGVLIICGSNGCDGLVTTALTVDTLNSQITASGIVLTALDPEVNSVFQWLDCGNNYAGIPGENSSLFTAESNGNYAFEVSANGCTDTSECITISTMSVKTISANGINVFPNRANDKLFLSSIEKIQPGVIRIYSTSGALVFAERWNGISLKFQLLTIQKDCI